MEPSPEALSHDQFAASAESLAEAQQYLASGAASTLRLAVRPTPLFVERGEGAEIVDRDGNKLIDFALGYGPLILGHAHPEIIRAVAEVLPAGSTFGAQHRGEVAVAERICAFVRNADLVCFSNSGTEAVMTALRIARAATGRNRVLRFAGHYHGWSDGILTAPELTDSANGWRATAASAGQPESALADTLVLPWNDATALDDAFARVGGSLAAVICEPLLCNSGCIYPAPGFLEQVRDLTRRYGVVLVFDEVITGFRLALGGAQERFGVDADLLVFGKALAGGFPLSAVAGRKALMGVIANGTVEHMGTLNANPIATAAAIATLEILAGHDGAAFAAMAATGNALTDGIRSLAASRGVPLVVNSAGQVFQTIFTEEPSVDRFESYRRRDAERGSRFAELLLYDGIFVRPNGLWYISTAHTEEHVEKTLLAVGRALAAL